MIKFLFFLFNFFILTNYSTAYEFSLKKALLISFNLNDWLALIFEIIMPVRDLIDVKNGKFRNILDIIFLRIYKFILPELK